NRRKLDEIGADDAAGLTGAPEDGERLPVAETPGGGRARRRHYRRIERVDIEGEIDCTILEPPPQPRQIPGRLVLGPVDADPIRVSGQKRRLGRRDRTDAELDEG